MWNKKIKVNIPKTHKCTICGKKAKLDYIDSYYITHDNVCVAFYKCECGNKDIVRENVKFI